LNLLFKLLLVVRRLSVNRERSSRQQKREQDGQQYPRALPVPDLAPHGKRSGFLVLRIRRTGGCLDCDFLHKYHD
jgi:hypothetical protein